MPSEGEGLPSDPDVAAAPPSLEPTASPGQAAGSKAKAKGKAKAKAKAKSKAKAKAKPAAGGKQKQLGRLPKPEGVKLGCCKCRKSSAGCAECRRKAGLILNAEQTAWIYKS